MVTAHAEFATDGIVGIAAAGGAGLVEPVFAADVVGHELVGEIAGGQKGECCGAGVFVGEVERAEVGLETVFLAAVEEYLELLGIGRGAEVGGAVHRGELIVIDGYVA